MDTPQNTVSIESGEAWHLQLLLVFGGTIFLSAWLLFSVQPLFARMVLPLLGGVPAVWNTAMFFFQAMLLAGYGYVHFVSCKLCIRHQIFLHAGLLLLPLFVLPIGIPSGWTPPQENNPIPWLLLVLCVSVGLPFFVVSTTSPILQKWFSATQHPSAKDPYFLYAASNIGSLLGLVAYPMVFERYFSLHDQSRGWALGYGAFMVLFLGCGWSVWRSTSVSSRNPVAVSFEEATSSISSSGDSLPLTLWNRARWIMLAFVPSSMMLGVTAFITSDIATVPLFWVIPLALYLLSFVMVFAQKRRLPMSYPAWVLPMLLVGLCMLIGMRATKPVGLVMVYHLAAFFVAALSCHGELARSRPPARDLTEYYLWMSVGGLLGGIFNGLVAPMVFTAVAEYPVILVLAGMFGVRFEGNGFSVKNVAMDIALPCAAGLMTWGLATWAMSMNVVSGPAASGLVLGPPALLCYFFSRRPLRFGLGLGAILWASTFYQGEPGSLLFVKRTFFGVHRVLVDSSSQRHVLMHGKTIHGMQSQDPERRQQALTYYHRTGPIGHVFSTCNHGPEKNVAIVGLGAGSVAVYGEPGQHWTFFEIDPVVEQIAKDPRFFTFLRDSAASIEVVLGDARLSMAKANQGQFSLIILDAYSSDAIPVHLLTREALQLFLDKLDTHGLMAFHISNLHLNLKPVVAGLARDAGLACRLWDDSGLRSTDRAEGKCESLWMVLARRESDLAPLASEARWESYPAFLPTKIWTDQNASILDVLILR